MRIVVICISYFLYFFLCVSCNERNTVFIPVGKTAFADTSGYELIIDSIKIPLDSSLAEQYEIAGYYNDPHSKELFYYGYHKALHRINLFSVLSNKFIKSFNLFDKDIRSFGDIRTIYVNNNDSIFVMDDFFIGLIDSTGNIKKKWPINTRGENRNPFFKKNLFFANQPSIFYFNKFDKCIYVQCYNKEQFSARNGFISKGAFRNARFIARFNLSNEQINLLDLGYPGEYWENYYGNIIQPSIEFTGRNANEIAGIFPVSPKIFHMQLNSDSAFDVLCKSSLTKNEVYPLDWSDLNDEDLKVKHFHKNINFFRLISADSGNIFFRFHYDSMDSLDNDFGNVYARKKLILTVIDKDMKICKETNMPVRNIRPILAFPVLDKIYIPMVDPEKKRNHILQFLTVKLKRR